eukprot:6987868-Prorocentrum_lima.AAC.1
MPVLSNPVPSMLVSRARSRAKSVSAEQWHPPALPTKKSAPCTGLRQAGPLQGKRKKKISTRRDARFR